MIHGRNIQFCLLSEASTAAVANILEQLTGATPLVKVLIIATMRFQRNLNTRRLFQIHPIIQTFN